MTARHWKFSQVYGLAFVGAILAFALSGTIAGGENSLMSDAMIVEAAL